MTLGAGSEGTTGQSAPDDLAEGPHVGPDPGPRGCSTPAETETGDHLVEEQQGADAIALGSECLKEARLGPTTPMLAATGSTASTATSSSRVGTVLYGTTTVSATADSVTPADPTRP